MVYKYISFMQLTISLYISLVSYQRIIVTFQGITNYPYEGGIYMLVLSILKLAAIYSMENFTDKRVTGVKTYKFIFALFHCHSK